MRYIVPFASTLHGAHFDGGMAQQEMVAFCKQLEAVRDQKCWHEAVYDDVCRSTYYFNQLLRICTWTKRSLHGLRLPQVGMVVEISEDSVNDENGGPLPRGTQITILHVGQEDDEAGYVYGEVPMTLHRHWLCLACVRVPGCQCPPRS